jgi:hypothetical protein
MQLFWACNQQQQALCWHSRVVDAFLIPSRFFYCTQTTLLHSVLQYVLVLLCCQAMQLLQLVLGGGMAPNAPCSCLMHMEGALWRSSLVLLLLLLLLLQA